MLPEHRITFVDDGSWFTLLHGELTMAGRPGKLRIESLGELKKTLTDSPECEFGLLVRGDRKVELEIDQKVIGELLKLLHKAVGHRDNEEY